MLQTILTDIKLFSIFISLSLILILFDNLNFFYYPKAFFQSITSPIQYGLYKTYLGIEKQLEFVVLSRRAAQENKALVEQLAQVLSENSNLRKKLSEKTSFLEQEAALDPQVFKLITARPIGFSRYLLIDKGSSDGIKINQPVVYKDNLIGKIKEVTPNKSQVILISDPDSTFAVYTANEAGRAKGILLGQFGTSQMLIDKILHQEPIKKGDLVYSEGTELEVPRGLIVGTVSEVLERDNEVFKQAKVSTVFDVSFLDLVFVITE